MTLEEKIYSEEYADFIIRTFYLNAVTGQKPLPAEASFSLNSQFSALFLPRSSLSEPLFGEIPYAAVPKLYTIQSTAALESAGILPVQEQALLQLTGAGVILGFLDTGIDYRHPAFKNSDGTTRILSIWDQTQRDGPPPLSFPYGTEYRKEELDRALQSTNPLSVVPTTDENGHGTFLAGVAGGSPSPEQNFLGAAPQADLAVVKLKPAKRYLKDFFFVAQEAVAFQENDLLAALDYLVRIAEREGKPLVICLGLGSNQGGRDNTLPLSFFLQRLGQLQGVIPVAAVGNEAGKAHHFQGEASNNGEPTSVEILVPEGSHGFSLELWGQTPQFFSVGFRSPAGETIPRIPVSLSLESTIRFVLEQTTVYVRYDVVTEGGLQLILMRFASPSPGIWNVEVYGAGDGAYPFSMWLPVEGFSRPDITFLTPSPYETLTTPASPATILSTGAYDPVRQNLYASSGRGYALDGTVKPDFAAPGVGLTGPEPPNGYRTGTGTSAAAALTAGAAALLAQWGKEQIPPRYFTGQEVRSYFIRGAARENGLIYPNREWGYGKLDLYQVFLNFQTI